MADEGVLISKDGMLQIDWSRCVAGGHRRFLVIHPFMDANGRIARVVTDQAARELLNESIGQEFIEDVAGYYSALAAADGGDLRPLEDRINAALQ